MKTIKTTLRNRMGEKSLSHLMNISIESPEKFSDSDLERNRKHRRMYIMIHNTELYNLEGGGGANHYLGEVNAPLKETLVLM